MRYWIFKVIYIPILFIIFTCLFAIFYMVFKDTGWEQPFRWLCIVAFIAAWADIYIKRNKSMEHPRRP